MPEWKAMVKWTEEKDFVTLIKPLVFDSKQCDLTYLVKARVLSTKCCDHRFEAIDQDHYFLLFKCAAAEWILSRELVVS